MTKEKCICTPHELLEQYKQDKTIIKDRLKEFRDMMKSSDETIFSELVFCLFTPQSSAKKCDRAVRRLIDANLLLEGESSDIAKEIRGVRFHNTKSARVITARNQFTENNRISIKKRINSYSDNYELREWLIKNVDGLGYKESSHFLRNIGLGFDMAILDRHILNNLKALDVIDCIPKSISKSRYLSIERKLIEFSGKIGLSPAELDLLLWSKETGEVFK
ncbi:MAG: N-glycosylase/DNA lyase [archaeon]